LSSITAVPSLAAAVSDKLLHVLLYSGLGFLAARGRTDAAARPMSPADGGLVIGFSAAYALSDELHQLVVPGRQFDTGDLVADVAGATLGAGAWWLWGILRRIRHA
jgi:VanZ family protein